MSVLFETTCGDSGLALTDEWTTVAGNISIDAGKGYQGTDGIISTTAPYSSPWLCKTVSPSPADTITVRWLQWIPAMPLTGFVTYVVAGLYYNNGGAFAFANRQVSLNTTDDGKFYFTRGSYNSGITIAGPTTNPVWVANTWNEIEFTVVIHDTAGSITLKKDGSTVLTATGLDTKALGTAAVDGIEIIPQSVSGSHAAIDDVIVSDTGTPPSIVGSAVFGVNTTVTNTRAVAFGLDNNTNVLSEAGKLKVFGDFEVTGTSTLPGFASTTRQRVRAATTANITIATALNNADTLDGVTLATGDLVLVKDQTAPAENGIYVVGATPARSSDYDTYNDHPGSMLTVQEGTANADTVWLCTSNAGGTLNTTAIAFTQVSTTSGAPTGAQYVTLATDATLSAERVLTGTANQITVTDGGAGGNVTLSTPQNLDTGATPQFGRLGLAVAADSSAKLKVAGQYGSTTYDAGNSSTALTLDWNNGNTQLVTLTGNCTFTLSNPKDGFRYLIVLKQDGTGSRTVTWPSAVKWQAGTAPTLSTTAGKADLVTLVWMAGLGASGNYLAAANTDYTPA